MVAYNLRPQTKQEIAIQRRQETLRFKRYGNVHLNGNVNRALQNRPWTREEYGGPTPQQTFAAGNSGKARCLVHGIIVV